MTSPDRPREGARGLVLVVEDEPQIAELQRRYLVDEGFGVHVERDGDGALAAVSRLHPVAVVLDVGLPVRDGISVCRSLREQGDWTPVLFVTARDDEVDRVLGLEIGADDYLTKPFSPRELVARMKAVLRRAEPDAAIPEELVLGDVVLRHAEREVFVAGEPVELTVKEFDLLAFLVAHPGVVFSREQLLDRVWELTFSGGTRTVDVHVAQVRRKLGRPELVRTVRGAGYKAVRR